MSVPSVKEILDSCVGRTWDKLALLHILKSHNYTVETQIQVLSYICDNFILEVSPHGDSLILDDQIYSILDTWDIAWRTVINSGAGVYAGHNPELVALQALCS